MSLYATHRIPCGFGPQIFGADRHDALQPLQAEIQKAQSG